MPTCSKTELCAHKASCFRNASSRLIITFVISYCLKGSAATVFAATTRRWHLLRDPRNVVRAAFGVDSIRFALFLGSLSGSYHAIVCILRRVRGKNDGLNAAIAGAISGSSIFMDSPGQRRYQVSLYILSRAVALIYNAMSAKGYLPTVPHGEVVIFCFVCSFVQYCFAYEPDIMRRSYFHFIDNLARDDRLQRFFYYLRNWYRVKIRYGFYRTDDMAELFQEERRAMERQERGVAETQPGMTSYLQK